MIITWANKSHRLIHKSPRTPIGLSSTLDYDYHLSKSQSLEPQFCLFDILEITAQQERCDTKIAISSLNTGRSVCTTCVRVPVRIVLDFGRFQVSVPGTTEVCSVQLWISVFLPPLYCILFISFDKKNGSNVSIGRSIFERDMYTLHFA